MHIFSHLVKCIFRSFNLKYPVVCIIWRRRAMGRSGQGAEFERPLRDCAHVDPVDPPTLNRAERFGGRGRDAGVECNYVVGFA